MNEGEVSVRLGLTGWPSAAEDLIVARNIILSKMRPHVFQYHQLGGIVELLRQEKKRRCQHNWRSYASPYGTNG